MGPTSTPNFNVLSRCKQQLSTHRGLAHRALMFFNGFAHRGNIIRRRLSVKFRTIATNRLDGTHRRRQYAFFAGGTLLFNFNSNLVCNYVSEFLQRHGLFQSQIHCRRTAIRPTLPFRHRYANGFANTIRAGTSIGQTNATRGHERHFDLVTGWQRARNFWVLDNWSWVRGEFHPNAGGNSVDVYRFLRVNEGVRNVFHPTVRAAGSPNNGCFGSNGHHGGRH